MQALIMARAVEMSGPKVFSVTVDNGDWIVWFRFSDEKETEKISFHFLRLWQEEEKFQRKGRIIMNKAMRKKPSEKQKRKPLAS